MATVTVRHSMADQADIQVKKSDIEATGETVAELAAGILARRLYGRRGLCVTCRLDSWAADGSSGTYQASIGLPASDSGYCVRSVWLYV